MDELIFAGNKYISSKRASKLTGYTTDYIGQMCRGDKMDCRLVGRNWYVNEGAVVDQKKSFKKEQTVIDKRAIEYKKLELEPMYYSDDNRLSDVKVSKTYINKEEEEEEEELDEVTVVEQVKVEKPKEDLISILSMIDSPMIDLRNTKKEVINRPARQVVKREVLLPQKSPVRLPVVKILASTLVLVGLLFTASTFILQQTVHYTSSDKTNIQTEFQLASIGSLFDL